MVGPEGIPRRVPNAASSLCMGLQDVYAGVRWTRGKCRNRKGQANAALARWTAAVMLLAVGWLVSAAAASPAGKDVAGIVAMRLEEEQIKDGPGQGMWPSEPSFAGPPIAGMACAYEWMSDPAYLQAAELGGGFILWMGDSTGHLLGDEAYALMRLSELSQEPDENVWRIALGGFYDSLRQEKNGTAGYIDLLLQNDPSTNVFYIAYHTVAAYYVDDVDKGVWRDALTRCLASVDDTSYYPVQALGAATWALARTGDLGDTVVTTDVDSYWSGVTLKDLPALLLSHQIPDGAPFAGSFYWHFDHATIGPDDLAGGWTEDAVYGTLGLVAAASGQEGELAEELQKAIEAAYGALLAGSDSDGRVFDHLSGLGESYHVFAGEYLQALWACQQYLDARMEPAAAEDDGVPAQ